MERIPVVRRPLVVVISSPSGGGKTTLCERLLREERSLVRGVTCTTRAPRGGEAPGRDYHFLSESEFAQRQANGEFLEHAVVHGRHYGTLRQTVLDALARGQDILLAIDVQGAAQIRAAARQAPPDDPLARGYVDVFVAPPSLDVLRERLRRRAEDAPEEIERRLRNAAGELERWREYRYRVVNDDLPTALAQIQAILAAEHCRV
jgi:guanylate kinase